MRPRQFHWRVGFGVCPAATYHVIAREHTADIAQARARSGAVRQRVPERQRVVQVPVGVKEHDIR
jgi:hypothetical protein